MLSMTPKENLAAMKAALSARLSDDGRGLFAPDPVKEVRVVEPGTDREHTLFTVRMATGTLLYAGARTDGRAADEASINGIAQSVISAAAARSTGEY